MIIDPTLSFKDVAFIVCSAFKNSGATVILSGGGAATIYAPDAYQSRDLDFVFDFWSRTGTPEKPLIDLGYERKGNFYRHPQSPFTIDIIDTPLSIGDEEITKWDTLVRGDQSLNIITPTDCVRDRLMWFMGTRPDYSGLEQALYVAKEQPIDLNLIESWMKSQGEADRFEIFKSRLDG